MDMTIKVLPIEAVRGKFSKTSGQLSALQADANAAYLANRPLDAGQIRMKVNNLVAALTEEMADLASKIELSPSPVEAPPVTPLKSNQ